MPTALTRPVPSSIARCELTHLERTPIDVDLARAQHDAYESALRLAGCRVEQIAPADRLPDSVFVEDAALIFDELAVITRPGAESRRAETASVAAAVSRYRNTESLVAPATLDGGDVLIIRRQVFVGLSGRTNREAVDQLARLLEPFGYTVRGVRVSGCLHLKSAATLAGPDAVLCNPAWVDASVFGAADVVCVDPTEPAAANVLRLGSVIIVPAAHPRTGARLARFGRVQFVDVSELARAEAGVTCCSLIVS